jgi:LemA protein
MSVALPALAFALGGPLLGALLLRAVTRQDHRTWVLARAPSLPIRTLAVGDDAWLHGIVEAVEPLVCPHFDVACVSYSYQRERKHTWTTRDKGKTQHHSEWRREVGEDDAIDFELVDGDRILVRMEGADNEAAVALSTEYETSSLRHSASIIEVGAEISVLAVKQDDGSFGAEREVPCLLTRKTRAERVKGSSRSEAWLFFFACLLAFAGGAGAAAWWLTHTHHDAPPPVEWLWLLPAGLLTTLPLYGVGAFNRFVRLRQQVDAAFRQVDVDLAVRAALVPNLIAVVRAHGDHENSLLTQLASIRAGRDAASAVAAERTATAATHRVLRLHESMPELAADPLYHDLHDRLWAIEEKLAHTRQLYNDIVTEWNSRIASFPQVLVAKLMRCKPAPWFAGSDEQVPPRLSD